MQTVKITRDTSADNKTVFEGDVLPVSDHAAKMLIGYGAAELCESDAVEPKPRKAREPKQTQNQGE